MSTNGVSGYQAHDGLSAPDVTLFPPREQIAFDTATDELTGATVEADAVVSAIEQVVADALDAESAVMRSLVDELIGAADVELTNALTSWGKWLNTFSGSITKTLSTARGDLESQGIQVPWSWVDMQAAVDGDWLQMVATAVPSLATALGMSVATPLPSYAGPSDWVSPPLPALAPTSPGEPPQTAPSYGPEPLYQTAPPGEISPAATNAAVSQWWANPPAQASQPADPMCCPAPVNVTVNVPPIVLPPYPNQPSYPAAPAAPAPPRLYPGEPPRSMIANGDVTYSTVYNSWVYNTPAPAPAPAAPRPNIEPLANPVPAPAPAPPEPVHAPLIAPIPVAAAGSQAVPGLNWGDVSVCGVISSAVAQMGEAGLPAAPRPNAGVVETLVDGQIGQGAWATALKQLKLDGPQWEANVREWKAEASEFSRTFDTMIGVLTQHIAFGQTPTQGVPQKGAAAVFGAKIALATKAQKATSFPMEYLFQSDVYALQFANPQFIPNQIRVDSAYLANTITDDQWICWTRALGNHPEPFRRVMLADQTRPGVMDVIQLYRRGHMKEADLFRRLRELGVLDPNYSREWLAITKQIPTQSDLIRFMVRDASDDAVSKSFGYDDGFDDKYTGQMKEWGTALGLDETYFKYQWRAHWNIPSYTQLTEMMARLRPDRLEIKEWEEGTRIVDDRLGPLALAPKPPTVTTEEVRKALQIDDMAPGWVDKLIAVSYSPINRTDAVRAYMMGAFSDEQLYDSFLNTRYSPRDAKLMLSFYKQDKERRLRNVTGSWSARKTISYYKNKLITREEAEQLLAGLVPSRALVVKTLEEAELEMNAAERGVRLKALKRGYMLGEYPESDLIAIMTRWGLDQEQADRLRVVWSIERDGRLKQPTVAMLSKWLHTSIISVEEARNRLFNLGYKLADADRIIAAALKMNYDGEPPSNEELSGAIQAEIKNQQSARKQGSGALQQRLKQIVSEATRIKKELDRRLTDADEEPTPAINIP
jgi:hypothetical protein